MMTIRIRIVLCLTSILFASGCTHNTVGTKNVNVPATLTLSFNVSGIDTATAFFAPRNATPANYPLHVIVRDVRTLARPVGYRLRFEGRTAIGTTRERDVEFSSILANTDTTVFGTDSTVYWHAFIGDTGRVWLRTKLYTPTGTYLKELTRDFTLLPPPQ